MLRNYIITGLAPQSLISGGAQLELYLHHVIKNLCRTKIRCGIVLREVQQRSLVYQEEILKYRTGCLSFAFCSPELRLLQFAQSFTAVSFVISIQSVFAIYKKTTSENGQRYRTKHVTVVQRTSMTEIIIVWASTSRSQLHGRKYTERLGRVLFNNRELL